MNGEGQISTLGVEDLSQVQRMEESLEGTQEYYQHLKKSLIQVHQRDDDYKGKIEPFDERASFHTKFDKHKLIVS